MLGHVRSISDSFRKEILQISSGLKQTNGWIDVDHSGHAVETMRQIEKTSGFVLVLVFWDRFGLAKAAARVATVGVENPT